MALITNGLQYYYNPKDGKKAGNVLNNITPGGVVKPLSVIGGTTLANGGLHMDGIDDYLTLSLTETQWRGTAKPFTIELVFTPRQLSGGDYYIFDTGGVFMGRFSWANLYWEFYRTDGGYLAGQTNSVSQLNTANVLNLAVTYGGGTSASIYFNGVLHKNQTTYSMALAAVFTDATFFNAALANYYKADFHALRIYNRALSAAELLENNNLGLELGVSTAPPMVKAGTFKAQTGDLIPVYDLAGHEAVEPFRFWLGTKKVFIPLVPVTDPAASRVRFQTPAGLRAWKK